MSHKINRFCKYVRVHIEPKTINKLIFIVPENGRFWITVTVESQDPLFRIILNKIIKKTTIGEEKKYYEIVLHIGGLMIIFYSFNSFLIINFLLMPVLLATHIVMRVMYRTFREIRNTSLFITALLFPITTKGGQWK
jgi:hypothetical protein